MATIELTKENFEETINNNEIVIIDFWAPWCGPCRTFAPVFDNASNKYPDVIFGKVNTDEQAELASLFEIQSIPTLIVFRQQIGVFSQPGVLPPEALDSILQQAKSLDMDDVRSKIAEAESEHEHCPDCHHDTEGDDEPPDLKNLN